jgi:hypothetical protein
MRSRPSVAEALAREIPLFHAEVARRKAALSGGSCKIERFHF